MSKTPIILVSGKAGSGKDTVGLFLKEKYNAGTIALADPMKRLAAELFGFSELTLWGPSACRNEEQHLPQQLSFINAHDVRDIAKRFVFELDLPNQELAAKKLDAWFWGQAMEHHEKGKISARTVLQTLGTEWGRAVSRNMWVTHALKIAQLYLGGELGYDRTKGLVPAPTSVDYVVITDGRFRNEVLGVSAVNGVSFRVHRPSQVTQNVGIQGHKSEIELDGIPGHFYTETLMNDKDIPALHGAVADAMAVTFGDVRMNTKTESFVGSIIALFLIVSVVAMAIGGCAHTCIEPEERAAQLGTVLECKPVPSFGNVRQINGRPVVRCLISTPTGDDVHHYGACR